TWPACTRPACGPPCRRHERACERIIEHCPAAEERSGGGCRLRACEETALMNPWRRKGSTIVGEMDRQEAAVLRGLVSQIEDMLRTRAAEAPEDELAELTGIRTGPSTAPDDPILSRLLPDFHRLDDDAPTQTDLDAAAAHR